VTPIRQWHLPAAAPLLPAAERAAFFACLALPPALLHARALAEILIAAIDVLFLWRCVVLRDTAWLRHPFSLAAGAWWVWLALCSLLGTGGLLLGLLAVRLPVLAMALAHWVLADAPRRQRAIWLMLALSAAWIALESWQQYLTGRNIFGQERWPDRALTGPFYKPRAAPALILLMFPVLLPILGRLLNSALLAPKIAACLLTALSAATLVLIGQRMPTALMVLGFAASALLLPRLRLAAGAAGLAAVLLVASLPWTSPEAYYKLVGQTALQLAHFSQSDYGLIFTRALTVAQPHPWIGLGFDAFRRTCSAPWSWHGVGFIGIPTLQQNGGMAACNLHPHNYYLEALDNAGWPGLVLFSAMAATCMVLLGRGLWRSAPPGRAGLFVGVLVALWPIASTSAFTSIPNAGWLFLIIGFGLALAPGNARRASPF